VQLSAIAGGASARPCQGRIEGPGLPSLTALLIRTNSWRYDASRADREHGDLRNCPSDHQAQTHISAAGLDQGMGIGLQSRIITAFQPGKSHWIRKAPIAQPSRIRQHNSGPTETSE